MSAHDASTDRPRAVDFATHNAWGDELSAQEREECVATLRELVEAFGLPAVMDALGQIAPKDRWAEANSSEIVASALRRFACIVVESDRPRLAGILVGKLVKWELAAGRRLSYRELGAQNGISKQAVSNRLKTYAAQLNLPRPDSTEKARESHRLMNRRNYGT